MEIGILRRVLKRAKRWSIIADEIPHLPERRDIGRALSQDQKVKLLKMVGAKPEWDTARLAAILALNPQCEVVNSKGCNGVTLTSWNGLSRYGVAKRQLGNA